jgi:hypothetical protein
MTLYSGRFWHSVISLDRRVKVAVSNCDLAIARFRICRNVFCHDAQLEFHLELCEALAELRTALHELRSFQERNSA